MIWLFYTSGAIAVISALLVVAGTNAMRSLINMIVAFLAIAMVLWTLGAPFAAVLQVVVYAGAILVLFVFVVMILNLGHVAIERERGLLGGLIWVIPILMAAILLGEFVIVIIGRGVERAGSFVFPKTVGTSLYTTYLIGIELASILLLAGLVAAYHFGAFMAKRGVEDE
ncbi:MAG: NADH-quinone oxidoreductase subunit J [Armatimonadota bacterium]